jgi:hypothetical protein
LAFTPPFESSPFGFEPSFPPSDNAFFVTPKMIQKIVDCLAFGN